MKNNYNIYRYYNFNFKRASARVIILFLFLFILAGLFSPRLLLFNFNLIPNRATACMRTRYLGTVLN